MTTETIFIQRLMALAKLCRFELDEVVLGLYDRALAPYGLARVASAIESVIVGRKTRDPFPSVKEIISIMVPERNDENESIEAVNRVKQAVPRFGRYRGDEAKEFIGELGWEVVQKWGGWGHLCENLGASIGETTFTAQARKDALSIQGRAKAGLHGMAPVIPLAPGLKRESDLLPAGKIFSEINFNPDDPPAGA